MNNLPKSSMHSQPKNFFVYFNLKLLNVSHFAIFRIIPKWDSFLRVGNSALTSQHKFLAINI